MSLEPLPSRIEADFPPRQLPEFILSKYYPSLDGFRALACLAVIISHLAFGIRGRPLDFLGDWGVDFFFVLSGFLITTLLIKEQGTHGSISLSLFYTRRALRIIPAAMIFLILMLGLNSIYRLGIPYHDFAAAALYVKNLPLNLSSGPKSSWYLAHFWSPRRRRAILSGGAGVAVD